MELKEFIERLKKRNSEMPETLQNYLSQVAGNDMATLIKTRVIQKEQDKDEKLFNTYSKAYAAYRKRKNKINTNKNFELTGDMWTHFGVIKTYNKGNLITVELGGTSQSAQNKINWQATPKQIGYSIIANTETEEKIIMQSINKYLINKLLK
jgi:hypothetical protein